MADFDLAYKFFKGKKRRYQSLGIFDFLKKKKEKEQEDKVTITVTKSIKSNPTEYISPLGKYKVDEIVDDSNYKDYYQYYENYQCPNCQHQFDKEIKGRRTCPACKEKIVARTHYTSGKKMLFSEKDIQMYDKERQQHDDLKWAVKLAVTDLGASDSDIEKMLNATRANTKFDILWGLANPKAMEHAGNFKWGMYRNVRLNMAYILNREGKKEHALRYYLIVSYLDLNGVRNAGWINDKPNIDLMPPFESEDSLPPGIIRLIKEFQEELNIDDDKLKEIYTTSVKSEHNQLMPLSPEKAWKKFWELYKEDEKV